MYRWRQNDGSERCVRIRLRESESGEGGLQVLPLSSVCVCVCVCVCVFKVDGLYICSVISPSQSNHFHLGPAQREAPDWR